MLGNLIRAWQEHRLRAYQIAVIYAKLGRHDPAFEWLDKARDERSEELFYLLADPDLAGLRSDPRFAALAHRLALR